MKSEPEGIGHYLRDVVYGANDGVITTFSVVAGSVGAELGSHVVLVLGFANLIADGISMGASNYLGMTSEIDRLGGSITVEKPMRHASATFAAFVLAGAAPLIPYIMSPEAGIREFYLSVGSAVATLAIVGASRSRFTRRSAVGSAFEMLTIGVVAGGLSYGVGWLAHWYFLAGK